MAPPSFNSAGCISSLGSTTGRSVGVLLYQSMSAVLHFGKSKPSGCPGVECFQPSLDISGKLLVSFSNLSSPASTQVPEKTCHRSAQTSNSSGTLLYGGSLASYSSQYIGRHSSLVSYHKGPCQGCLSRLGSQGWQSLNFTL